METKFFEKFHSDEVQLNVNDISIIIFAEELNFLNRLQLFIWLCDKNLFSRLFGASVLPLITVWILFITIQQEQLNKRE